MGYRMGHIRKICPICGKEFIVMENVKEKAVYCTLKCLSESHDQINENIHSFLHYQNELLA
jgi:hypothetical protein